VNPDSLDFCGLPVWEQRALVLEALDRVPRGSAISFITEIEPRGLSARIAEERFGPLLVETNAVGRDRWLVRMTRRAPDDGRNPILRVLQGSPIFARLGEHYLEKLAQAGAWVTGRRGQHVIDGDALWPYIGVVADGVVAVATGSGAREQMAYELFPYDAIGVEAFFDRGAPVGSIVAMTKTARIVKVPYAEISRLAAEVPQLLVDLGIALAQRQRLLASKLAAQSALPIVGRVARVLLPHAMAERGLSPAMPALASMTQTQIAAAAGTVKEVAARAIAELDERGLLRRERGHIRFLDRQGLVELLRELGET